MENTLNINYRGLNIRVSKEKIEKYKYHKAISFDTEEIDAYISCEYHDVFENPLEHLEEIGVKKMEEIVDEYLQSEIEVGEHD